MRDSRKRRLRSKPAGFGPRDADPNKEEMDVYPGDRWIGIMRLTQAMGVLGMFMIAMAGTPRSVLADDPPECEDYTIASCLYPWSCEEFAGLNCGEPRRTRV